MFLVTKTPHLKPLTMNVSGLLAGYSHRPVLLLYLFFFMFGPSRTQCPAKCSCSPSVSSGLAVSCGPGLTSFPSNISPQTDIFSIGASHKATGQSNSILFLTSSNFDSFTSVVRIRISFCNTQSVAPGTFSKLSNLVKLDLQGNNLQRLSRTTFSGLTTLQHLVLTDNTGCHLDNDVFDDLVSLKTIELGGLQLKSLGKLLNNLKSLENLDLHGNDLFRLQYPSFKNLNNLKYLDLTFNNLYGIDTGLQSIFSNIKSINLGFNPWRCNCALAWMKTLPAKFVAPSRGGGDTVVCDQPQRLQFRDLVNVPDVELTCVPARILSCSYQTSTLEGQPILIACEIEGDPFPDVTWALPNGSNASAILMTSTKATVNFSIPISVYSQHNGKWYVIAENCNGSNIKTIDMDIITTTTAASTSTQTTSSTLTRRQINTTFTAVNSPKITLKSNPSNTGKQTTKNILTPKVTPFPTNMQTPLSASNKTMGNDSLKTGRTVRVILIAAAAVSACVFITGTCICIVLVYKSKSKARISVKRRSVYSRPDDFELSSGSHTPLPPLKDVIYFRGNSLFES